MTDLRFKIAEVAHFERPVRFRMPFRYGVVTLRESPEAYVTVRIELPDGRSATGVAADLLAPKWFDKSPDLTDADNHDQLRLSIKLAAEIYRSESSVLTAYQHHTFARVNQYKSAAMNQLPGLVAGFGQALVDRAILDACCRMTTLTFAELINRNVPGITSAVAQDLSDFDFNAFFSSLKPEPTILLRHTVGLTDAIEAGEAQDSPADGLPVSLEEHCETYGLRSFKIKLSGDTSADLERLTKIARVLDRLPDGYFCTLDGNENFSTPDTFGAFWTAAQNAPELNQLMTSVEVVEQPIARQNALSTDLGEIGSQMSIEIDESDADYDAFPRAKDLGYRAVSSKSCKGVYRSLINRARVEKWNAVSGGARYFMTAEDLCTQAGVALQQDLALAALIGCSHVERNGHQYGDGLSGASGSLREEFFEHHPDLYLTNKKRLNLKIKQGLIDINSVAMSGYGTSVPTEKIVKHLDAKLHI